MSTPHDPKWSLFYDFHTMPGCPDVGANFDAEAFAQHLVDSGVDYVVFPARCNLGMAYYDTKIGTRHFTLQYDLLRRLVDACTARGIALSAYINVGLSHQEALEHRDWAVVSPEGYVYQPDRLNHFFRSMCYNSPYRQHLLAMVEELARDYPIAGFFLDCFTTPPCVGVECIRAMRAEGVDWEDPAQLAAYTRRKWYSMAEAIVATGRGVRNDLLFYFNGIPPEKQEGLSNYFEFECLPTGGWGYESLPIYARYIRNFGKTVLNMTGRFHRSWGDFGGIRTEPSLEYDCRYGLANGMRCTIGGHYHPRGDINHPVNALVRGIYNRLQRLDPWTLGATPQTDVGVIIPAPGLGAADEATRERARETVTGATRMLCELNVQFDVLAEANDWSGYEVLVLPDWVILTDELAARIRAHLDAGGRILSSGHSGLNSVGDAFALPAWDMTYTGESPHDPAYFRARAVVAADIPEMPNNCYSAGITMTAGPAGNVLADIVAPLLNRGWDGEHGNLYLPPGDPSGEPLAVQSGPVIHVSHALFGAYHNHACVVHKQLVGNLLARLLPRPLVTVTGLPSFGRVTVTAQPGRRIVHLLAYVPERRGVAVDMIEEPILVDNVTITLRHDGDRPVRAYLAPDETPVELSVDEAGAAVRLSSFRGHAVLVFEHPTV